VSPLAQPRGVGALQRWFFERVTRTDDIADGADERLILGAALPARARLDIYRNAYIARLLECLADDYPALAHALGASAFEATCRDFVAHHPPSSASLNFYGAPFAEHCRTRTDLLNATFVAELARLEWALVEVIHADAETILESGALAGVAEDAWPRLRLVPSPALRVLRCDYPVHRYYRAFVEDEAPGLPEPEPCGVAVCRRTDDVWRFGLTLPWLGLLESLRDGTPLAEALVAFEATASERDASALQQTFGEWVAAGFFAGITLD
jgi:hypothetical protein